MRFDPLEKLTMVALMESIKKVILFHSLLSKVRIFLEQPSHVDKVNFVPGQKKDGVDHVHARVVVYLSSLC